MGNLFRCGTGKPMNELYIQRISLYTGTVAITFKDENNATRKKCDCYFRLPEGVKKIKMGKVYVLNGTVILYGTNFAGSEIEIKKYSPASTTNNVTVNVSSYTNVYFYAHVVGAYSGAAPTTVGTSYIEGVTLEF